MRILILHSRYVSGDASGENRVVEDESRLLREAGHDVWVWAPSPEVAGPLGLVRAGVSAVWSATAAREVALRVRRERIDVVHVHNLFPSLSPTVLRSAKAAGAAVVVTLHNYRLMCLPANLLRDQRVCEACVGRLPWRGIVHRCYRDSGLGSAALATSLVLHRSLRTFDAVSLFLAVSDFVRRKHIEAGIHPRQIAVKSNFTWPASPRSGPGAYFLFLGRLAPEKGLETLLRAWDIGEPALPLVVAGDGPDADALRRIAPTGVDFRGLVPTELVAELVAGARAVMVPSRWYEAAPRVITEAYAAGVPVMASDIGALPEAVLEGVSGRLVHPEDPKAWADAVALLDGPASVRLGAGALRLWEERFSPERGLAHLEAAYGDAMKASA